MDLKEILNKIACAVDTAGNENKVQGQPEDMFFMSRTGPVKISEMPDELIPDVVDSIIREVENLGKKISSERFIANLATQTLKRNIR